MRTTRNSILLILLMGIAVHAATLAVTYIQHTHIDAYAFGSLDGREFYHLAQNLARHGAFSADAKPPLSPDTWRTPGYPLLLTPFVLLFGGSTVALVLMQQVLAVINVLLIYLIARRWMGEWRAWIVAMLFLIEPYGLYYSLWLMSETWFVTVLLLTWLAWLTALDRGRWSWFAAVGALSGFLVLVRPVAILVPVALTVGTVFAIARRTSDAHAPAKRKPAWTAPVALGAACLIVLGSWMARNRIVAGNFALADQGGVVLAYFKAAEVELWRQDRTADRYMETTLDTARRDQPHSVWDNIDRRLQEELSYLPEEVRATLIWRNLAQGNRSQADPFEVSQALTKIGVSSLLESPLSTLACSATRCAEMLTFPLGLALRPPTGVQINRIEAVLSGVIYTLLCIAVVVRLIRRRLTFGEFYFPLACTIALLVGTTPQLDPRFRLPMIPMLLLMAVLPTARQPATTPDPSADATA